MWNNIGVKFEYTGRRDMASFEVKYHNMPSDDNPQNPSVYAQSFFPQDQAGTLFIYKLALEDANIGYLANILAHEIGHILGLRHEFPETELSVRWGKKNKKSVMNYFMHPSKFSVQEQDLIDLESFYNSTMGTYKGWPIRDFDPSACTFSIDENVPQLEPRAVLFLLLLFCLTSGQDVIAARKPFSEQPRALLRRECPTAALTRAAD
ncbi:hypothetical protein F5Y01DRAFT_275734 [Xylaria sp. FL0043]|nr:hypothetical protein F5Y01DRAFT_275734 [Xylaria sp. FL0043]